jgi:hypothetical protein
MVFLAGNRIAVYAYTQASPSAPIPRGVSGSCLAATIDIDLTSISGTIKHRTAIKIDTQKSVRVTEE